MLQGGDRAANQPVMIIDDNGITKDLTILYAVLR